ncbi:MAG: hypothetical protein JWQ94_2921 [Tardiphaga sp.]|jgi:hypothetical protein|nr:hypothetical protein [Tardiphaga sp.]
MSKPRTAFEMREMHADLTVMRLRADRLGLADFSALLGQAVVGLKHSLRALDAAPAPTLWRSDAWAGIELGLPTPTAD